ncbi:MAG: hypothetical protein A2W91_15925 [Bacteroidetes bacterium GWF2_38_335]|nr:MAG: hypothetical protein A2W91_15925 [Bacteroidetes bacterium GWF2_38_335]OFY81180.1 MAG: hypothetical protein A2281_06900 [Bacteroidetes bacterium RIFOXYA12_FULL_38_20]HBS85293.1 hypothetical protein [Bacteroidales bacterium]
MEHTARTIFAKALKVKRASLIQLRLKAGVKKVIKTPPAVKFLGPKIQFRRKWRRKYKVS